MGVSPKRKCVNVGSAKGKSGKSEPSKAKTACPSHFITIP